MEKLRILIADDHAIFRDGMHMLLDAMPDMEVVGEASTGDETIEQAQKLSPDLILMDIRMPGMSGIEASRQILGIRPQTRILVVTIFEDDATVFTAMRAGARGYILKDASKIDIQRAIHAVAKGEAIFSPSIASRLMDFFARAHATVPREIFPSLTSREREILQLIVHGSSNTEIADLLSLSNKTIANYVSQILNKLQVIDRESAVKRALEEGASSSQLK